jgi:hypothetical protein
MARPWLATALFLAGMSALAQASGLKLLLFPELGALASVVFSDPASLWARSPLLLVLTPVLTAVPGVLITRSLPYGPLALVLDVAVCLLVIRGLRSPIVPAISAGVLPLALGITSWYYPLAILAGTGGLALLVILRPRFARGLRRLWGAKSLGDPAASLPSAPSMAVDGSGQAAAEPVAATLVVPPPVAAAQAHQPSVEAPAAGPVQGQAGTDAGPGLRTWLPPLAIFLAGGLVLVELLGSHLVLYPPLMVIAYEMLAQPQHCPWQGRVGAVLAVTGGAALAGLLLVQTLGVVPLATLLAVLATALLLHLSRLTCPPAYGLALLPFVIPTPPQAYPLLTLAGTAWLLLVVELHRARERRRGGGGGNP